MRITTGEMRKHDEDEAVDRSGPVHLGGLELLAIKRLERGEKNQGGKRKPLPGNDGDDREHRRVRKEIEWLQTQKPGQLGKESVHRIHEHVLPDQRGNGGHHEERRDDQKAHDVPPPHLLVEQERKQYASDDGDDEDADDQRQRVPDRVPEAGIGQKEVVVRPPGPLLHAGHQEIVTKKGEIERETERYQHPAEKQHDGRRDHQPACNPCVPCRHQASIDPGLILV